MHQLKGERTHMRTIALALVLISSATLFGCASSPGPAPATEAAPAQPIAPPVALPAAAAKRVVLMMGGPRQVTDAKDWAELKREWRETFADHARSAGVAFEFLESGEPQQGRDGTVLRVTVDDYRIVGIGSRMMFGIMTGNAFINARIKYGSLRDGSTFGEQQFNTASSAASGIFAKVTPQQVNAIATEVFRSIAAAR
jgi:hypothetical protein